MKDSVTQVLSQLAGLHGVQTSYQDVDGHLREASPEAIVAALQALGAPILKIGDASEALRLGGISRWRRRMAPVAVAWERQGMKLLLRLPRAEAKGRGRCVLFLEDESTRQWSLDLAHLPVEDEAQVEGMSYVALRVELSGDVLPLGYHRLSIEVGGVESETTVIAAPSRVYRPTDPSRKRTWGVFAPVYALSGATGWGVGDLSELRRLMDLTEPLGASTFAILPLLATFLGNEGPYSHSPYMPVSRLFWNELYIDPSQVPELKSCPEAREIIASPSFEDRVEQLNQKPLIDYVGAMALKREVLELLASRLFESGGERLVAFEQFLSTRPEVDDYAAFRATCERRGASWHTWQGAEREGDLAEEARQSPAARYHRYVQWIMHEQLTELSERARREGEGLYLDLPVGVHPDGYDAWREREVFALAASAGAPPDPFFTKGQDWGFPPLDPEGSREQGHRYFIASIRNHLRYAGILRIDHVMGLHRLYWVPRGFSATEGVYVGYPAEELYAILCLESHRAEARIIGENLGTVPEYVNEEMGERCVQGMYVGQFSISTDPAEGLLPPRAGSLASLNTHDMPTFAAYWTGFDIHSRQEMGLLDEEQTRHESDMRGWQKRSVRQWLLDRGELNHGLEEDSDEEVFAVFSSLLRILAESEAEGVLISLEDLWLEREPQNVPGTYREYPNWQRRMRQSVTDIASMERVLALLRDIEGRRKRQEN